MPIYRNGTRVTAVSYNSTNLIRVVYNSVMVWGKFTATFAGLSGASPTSYTAQVRLDDEQVTSPGSPTKTGYTFTGWSPSLPRYIDDDYVFTAQWSINYYDVTFKNWDGTQIGTTQSIAYGSNATPPANPTRTADAQYTYAFSHWSPGYTAITSTRDCIAQYTPTLNYYDVYFRDWNSTLLDTDNVGYGSAATYGGATPSRTGYTWTGWDASLSNITGTTTVYATYSINYYTVTFRDWDGAFIDSDSVSYGGTATPPADPYRSPDAQYTYSFDFWYPSHTNVTSNMDTYATYDEQLNYYNVYFRNWDGTLLDSDYVGYGSAATYGGGTPGRTGYTFDDWDTGFEFITDTTTVYATFVINSYTVNFYSEGSLYDSQSVDYGGDATAPTDPTRSGHTFDGWDTSFTNVTSNINVYATWVANSTWGWVFYDSNPDGPYGADYDLGATGSGVNAVDYIVSLLGNPEDNQYISAECYVTDTGMYEVYMSEPI